MALFAVGSGISLGLAPAALRRLQALGNRLRKDWGTPHRRPAAGGHGGVGAVDGRRAPHRASGAGWAEPPAGDGSTHGYPRRMRSLELRVPPVVLVAVAAGLMALLAWAFPRPALVFPAPYALGGALVGLGAAIAVAGVLAFRRARTTVNPMTPGASSSVVSTGIYRLTRNPMYLGFLLALAGWGAILGNLLVLLPLAAFVAWMDRFQIAPEERALREKFGADYEDYLRRVRRWI